MSLDQETRENTVLYRVEKALRTWDDVSFAVENKRWNYAANRMYYTVFHAASALLIANSVIANTHRGFLTQVSYHFVKPGLITKEEGRLIRHLFDLRNEDDYENFADAEEDEILDLFPKAQQLLNKLIKLNKLYQPPRENPEQ